MQDVVLLGVVHVVEGLHGAADLLAGHLLEEGEGEAVRPGAVLPGDDEGVELRLPGVHLRPEGQALRHAELRGGGHRRAASVLTHTFTRHFKCSSFDDLINLILTFFFAFEPYSKVNLCKRTLELAVLGFSNRMPL